MSSKIHFFLKSVLAISAIFHLILLYFGLSGISTTITFYITFFYIIDRIIVSKIDNVIARSNWSLMFKVSLITLLFVEFGLKYGIKTYLSYPEKNGAYFYSSPFRQVLLENYVRRFIIKQDNVGLRTHKPNDIFIETTPDFTYSYQMNRYGLKEKDSIGSGKRVLALGDSFTEGAGASQDSGWVRQIEYKFAEEFSDIVFINAGNGGSDVFYEFYKLNQLFYEVYHPEVIIIGLNSSDIFEVIIRGGSERFINNRKVAYNNPPWWEYFYSFSFIVRNVVHGIVGIDRHYYTKEKFAEKEKEAREMICDCISNEFNAFAKSKGAALYVVISPMLWELEGDEHPFLDCKERLMNQSIPVIDLFPAFSEIEDFKSLYWQNDRHNNHLGYALWAEVVYNEIIAEVSSMKDTSDVVTPN